MLKVDVNACPQFVAGDATLLREVLHPSHHPAPVPYSLAHAVLPSGKRSLPHRLRGSEVYYFLQGHGVMHIDGQREAVRAGHVVYVPPGATQYVDNTGDEELAFLCIVHPAWRADDEEVEGAGDMPQHEEGLS
ncbi:MAG TPA: cupin domain-containing protein [Chloroflexia bacterium]